MLTIKSFQNLPICKDFSQKSDFWVRFFALQKKSSFLNPATVLEEGTIGVQVGGLGYILTTLEKTWKRGEKGFAKKRL